jgi:hypothetical protein
MVNTSASSDLSAARTLEDIRRIAAGLPASSNRAGAQPSRVRLSAFQAFLSTNSHVLQSFPRELIPLARNESSDGYVSVQAEHPAEILSRLWIARDSRPSAASLCSSKLRTMVGGGKKVAITSEGAVAISADSRSLYV